MKVGKAFDLSRDGIVLELSVSVVVLCMNLVIVCGVRRLCPLLWNCQYNHITVPPVGGV